MIWGAIHYDWSSAALLLFLVFFIAWSWILLYRYRKKKLESFSALTVREAIMQEREPTLFWIKVCLYCLAWLCGVLALMQPKGNERYLSPENGRPVTAKEQLKNKQGRKKHHEVIFLIDASASMKIADISGKTRLDVSKEIADDVIRHLKGENVSLFAFTSAAMQIVPSTLDYLFTRLMLQQIEINEAETEGTDIKLALQFVANLYLIPPLSTTKTLIVFSDGGDTSLEGLTSEQREKQILNILSPLKDAAEKNLRILVVGVAGKKGKEIPGMTFQGKPVISSLEESLLRQLSISGRGSLFILEEVAPFQVSQAISRKIAQDEAFVDASKEAPLSDPSNSMRLYDLYFQFPLAIAILALAGCLLIPDTSKLSLLRFKEGRER